MKILKSIKAMLLVTAMASLVSCNESPVVDFHSYEELCEYPFFNNNWRPEIVNDDLFDIRLSYDTYNKHVFGRYEFKIRSRYDSIVKNYLSVKKEDVLKSMDEIDKPKYPDWLDAKGNLTTGKYLFLKHKDFYLLMDKKANRIIFFK